MADSANWTDLSQLKSMPLLYPEDSPAYKAGTVLTEGLTEIVAPEEQTRRLALNDEEVRTFPKRSNWNAKRRRRDMRRAHSNTWRITACPC
jgi:hypothetical protein